MASLTVNAEGLQRVWPGISLDASAWLQSLALTDADPRASFLADLYLAQACLANDRQALVYFETHVLNHTPAEIRGNLRDIILPPPTGQSAALAGYRGHGPMRAWVRMIAIRYTERESTRATRSLPVRSDLARTAGDIGADMMRARFGSMCKVAMHAVLQGLDIHERVLLRLHYAYGVSCDTLAGVYKSHRMTIWRTMQALQQRVASELRECIHADTGASPSEIESMLTLVDSRLQSLLSEWFAQPLRA